MQGKGMDERKGRDLGTSAPGAESKLADGLHPDRVNANCGAESVVSALLAAADMNAMELTSRLAVAGQNLLARQP